MSSSTFMSRRFGTASSDTGTPGNDSDKGLAAMLLAAIVSAMLVAADALIDSYADGHLLVGWTILWAVGFIAMAVFAGTARNAAKKLLAGVGKWRAGHGQRQADRALLASAEHDPRIMADLQAAIERSRVQRQKVQLAHGRAWVEHRPVGTLNAAYPGPRTVFRSSPMTGLPVHLQYLPG